MTSAIADKLATQVQSNEKIKNDAAVKFYVEGLNRRKIKSVDFTVDKGTSIKDVLTKLYSDSNISSKGLCYKAPITVAKPFAIKIGDSDVINFQKNEFYIGQDTKFAHYWQKFYRKSQQVASDAINIESKDYNDNDDAFESEVIDTVILSKDKREITYNDLQIT